MTARELILYITAMLISLIIIFHGFMLVTGGYDQITREQSNRHAFYTRCLRIGGKVITFQKADINKVCVSPDGRWLEYY